MTINDKSIDDVLGIQTQVGSLVGVDETIELWRRPWWLTFFVQWSIL